MMFVQRIRVRFRKIGELRAISHLDLMRAFERALRRANLPLRMTEGFNPHPRISFPAALGVGIEGLDEVMEFDLADWIPIEDARRKLAEQLPQGLEINRVELAAPHGTAQAKEVEYRITPSDAFKADARLARTAVEALLDRTEIPVERTRKGKLKTVNLRPLIVSATADGGGLVLRVKAGNEGSVHPEEILGALGFKMPDDRGEFEISRTRVLLAE